MNPPSLLGYLLFILPAVAAELGVGHPAWGLVTVAGLVVLGGAYALRLDDLGYALTDLGPAERVDVKAMLEQSHNARNKQAAAWRRFIALLKYKGELYGTHVVEVEAAGTTKECAKCGVETAKPIWVREHSCPSCGFECDRDANAAMNVLQ